MPYTKQEKQKLEQTRWSVPRFCASGSRILSSFRSMNISGKNWLPSGRKPLLPWQPQYLVVKLACNWDLCILLAVRLPQRSEYSGLHTYCQAFTISGRITMSAGQVSAGFLFWAQRPQIAGMTATQKKLRRRIFPFFFCPNAERLWGYIFWERR